MFRGLRLRLTLLYLLVALAFTALMMFGTHQLVARYFQATTDLALRYRMAQEFTLLGVPLPSELKLAIETWSQRRASPTPLQTLPPSAEIIHEGEEHEAETSEHEQLAAAGLYEQGEEAYDGELASIYTLPLDDRGQLQTISISSAPALPPDPAAVQNALINGHDLRTIELDSGTQVRLLTYSISGDGEHPAYLQLGRPLKDQQSTLNQLITAMAGLGGVMLLILSGGSWWLAGRSISPTEAAWRKQQTFVANAGHELRTPLTLIRANTEVALRGMPARNPQREKLEDILQETEHMGKLVADLLLLSRLDSDAVKLDLQPVNAGELLSELVRQSEALAAEGEVTLELGASEGTILADPVRLRQVLLILLDNAIGHTPAGGRIRLASAIQSEKVQISVNDTGVGISQEHLQHVFERFYQVERSGRAGSGLGLSIAKSLAQAMNGDLELISGAGQGTTALLTLPASA
jgi:signal transduction histidine kinase